MSPTFYRFHIAKDGDTFISDNRLVNLEEPTNYKEAMVCPKVAKWKKAMDREI